MIIDVMELSLQEKILFSTVRIVTNNGSGLDFSIILKLMIKLLLL